MPRKKKKKDEEFADFSVQQLAPAPAHVNAVFHDPDDEDGDGWCYFPVIAFAVGTVTIMKRGEPIDKEKGIVRGMISNHGGLELVEDTDDLEFIGYWRKDAQPTFDEFLQDHGIDAVPGEGTDDPTFAEDEDDEDDE